MKHRFDHGGASNIVEFDALSRLVYRYRHRANENDTYYIRGVAVLDLQEVHRPDHRLHRHENILVHEFDKPSLVFVRVAGAVDNPHLLNEGRFARLAGTCETKFRI